MTNDYSALVGRVWNYVHVLRRQGVPYGDYIEQITYLLFLKMDDEREELLGEPSHIPAEHRWDRLRALDGDDLENQYRHSLEALARQKGLIGLIFKRRRTRSPIRPS